MDGCDEYFDAKAKEVNVQALTVVLKELKRSLTDNSKRAMAKSSLVEDIFKTTGRWESGANKGFSRPRYTNPSGRKNGPPAIR